MRIPVDLLDKWIGEQTHVDNDVKAELVQIEGKNALELDTLIQFNNRKSMIVESAVESFEDAFERYLGSNDLLPINYLEIGLLRSRAIGRLTYFDNILMKPAMATGFLVSSELLMTNHHVFSSINEFSNGRIEFNFEYDIYGNEKQKIIYELDPNRFFYSYKGLDFALTAVKSVDITGNHQITEQGYLILNGRLGKAGKGDYATIIQHPEGKMKQIAIRENQILDVESSSESITYYSDTAKGSSGSAVFNNEWQLIALHSAGVAKRNAEGQYLNKDGAVILEENGRIPESEIVWISNKGIRISAIIAHLKTNPVIAAHSLIAPLFLDTYSDSRNLSFLSLPALTPIKKVLNYTFPEQAIQPIVAVSPLQHPEVTINISGISGLSSQLSLNGKLTTDLLTFEKRIEDELDFSTCNGFDEYFLGFNAPLPDLDIKLKKKVATLVENPNLYILKYHHYSVVQHAIRKMPVYSAINVLAGQRYLELEGRDDKWFRDRRIDFDVQLNDKYYSKSGFDRGHLSRREDAEWGNSIGFAEYAANMTCSYTNACPQVPGLNRSSRKGLWGVLENEILERSLKREHDLTGICAYSGPIFDEEDPVYLGIQVPLRFWKLIVWVDENSKKRTTAFTLSQQRLVDAIDFEKLRFDEIFVEEQISVQELEQLTQLRFAIIREWDTYSKVSKSQTGRISTIGRAHIIAEEALNSEGVDAFSFEKTVISPEQIKSDVVDFIANEANLKAHLIKDTMRLTRVPLKLDSTALQFLTVNLNFYVQGFNPTETVLYAEVSKSDLTVGGLVDLITKKISKS